MRGLFTLLVFVNSLMFGLTARAQEEKQADHTYSPEFCEFAITFPSEPYTSKRCDEDDNKKCYDQISYTQVYENLTSTVNFRVICNPIGADMIKAYDENVMTATLRAMTKRSVVETFDTSYREGDDYKQAGLVGEGQAGKLSTLYIAQLWIGQKSAFSVEAELIGEAAAEPDKLFSDILKSVGLKTNAAETPATAEAVDTPANAEPEKKN